MSVQPKSQMTAGEYLILDRRSPEKHEYHEGQVFAKTGASLAHNTIVTNLVRSLGNQLADRPCLVLPSDMRVCSKQDEIYVYPDVTVLCHKPEFADVKGDSLINPTVIIEVLSKSTEAYDRGNKFLFYRAIPSVKEYLLVAQESEHVERFFRDGRFWVLDEVSAGNTLKPAAIDCQLPLSDVYRKVFDPLV